MAIISAGFIVVDRMRLKAKTQSAWTFTGAEPFASVAQQSLRD
jgi:hypothetical protein